MRADKRCKTCEWWDITWQDMLEDGEDKLPCLRWVQYGLQMPPQGRCWQHVKRTSETAESVARLEPLPEDVEAMAKAIPGGIIRGRLREAAVVQQADLRDATRLVIEAGLATGHADTCVDLISEVLTQVRELQEQAQPQENVAYMNLKLVQARRIIQHAYGKPSPGAAWKADAKDWLESGDKRLA